VLKILFVTLTNGFITAC